MTAYFDALHKEVEAVPLGPSALEQLSAIEQRCVFDCTVAAMFPEMPAGIRAQIHRTVLTHGVDAVPVNAAGVDFADAAHLRWVGGDPDETDPKASMAAEIRSRKRVLNALIWDLHSAFHEAVHHPDWPYGDTPTSPLRVMYARGEAEREAMVMDGVAGTRSPHWRPEGG